MNKTLRLNIYLTPKDKNELTKIKYKYHLSYSTIARLVGEVMTCYMNNAVSILNESYLYENDVGQCRTSIKPRKMIGQELKVKAPTIFYTNVLKIFARNEEEKYLDIKSLSKYQKELIKAFETEKDDNWNGNEWQRRLPKMIKQNKDYYKKLLEE